MRSGITAEFTGLQRFVSPCRQRIALVNMDTGDLWLMRRQSEPEAADIMTLLPTWSPPLPPLLTILH